MDSFVFATVHELSRAIRQRDVSAVEIIKAYLDQIGRYNPQLNAIVTLDAENATARAKELDGAAARGIFWGPLHGIPITLKDSLCTAGLRTTSGHPDLSNYCPA